jgi:hypothetical protein
LSLFSKRSAYPKVAKNQRLSLPSRIFCTVEQMIMKKFSMYLRQQFGRETDFGVTKHNYDFSELLARAHAPN